MKGKKKGIHFLLHMIKKIFFSVLTAIVIYLFFALLFSFLPTHPARQECTSTHEIFIASNGIHLDIIVPVENIEPQFLQKLRPLHDTRYIAFGWGDKEFYIKTPEWSDLTFPVAFKALFLKSETAMHVTYLPQRFPSWRKVNLCSEQLAKLKRYISNSFQQDENSHFTRIDFEGYNQFDAFYEANGSFSLFKTCNVWVNTALREAEVKTAVWSPFDFGVLLHVSKE
jgi:uncharacterized protein (TIGR02117 family)